VFDVKAISTEDLNNIYDYIVNEHQIVKDYPEILEAQPETRKIQERGGNTVTGIIKKLRAFFNWCEKEGLLKKNPFIGFEKGEGEQYGTPIYLTKDELKQIYAADFSDNPSLETQRDIFVFQCNVGCRVGDMMRLTKRDVINGSIEYIPNKTIKENAKTVVVPLNSMAKAILEKYKDLPGEQLLPFIASQNYNYAIKDIVKKAGITRLVTTLDPLTRKEVKRPINEVASSHMARRTFIGNIYKKVKDQHLVSSLTGHSDNSRAFVRYRNIDIDMKQELVNILD
jgi:integrase